MGRKALEYGAGLIALYLVVAHASAFGTIMTSSANGTTSLTKALQGR